MAYKYSPYVNRWTQDREDDMTNPFRQGGENIPLPQGNGDMNNQMTPLESSRYSLLQQLLWRQERPSIFTETEIDYAGKTHRTVKRAPWADENDYAISQILSQMEAIDKAELDQLEAQAKREDMAHTSRLRAIGMEAMANTTDPVERHAYFQAMSGFNSPGLYGVRTAEIDAEGNTQAAWGKVQAAQIGADARRHAADRGAQSRITVEKIRGLYRESERLIAEREKTARMMQSERDKDIREQLQARLSNIERRLHELQGALKSESSRLNATDAQQETDMYDDGSDEFEQE